MKPSDGPNTQEIHEIPALHSLVPCNSLVSKLILKKTAKDQGCLGIKGTTSPLLITHCHHHFAISIIVLPSPRFVAYYRPIIFYNLYYQLNFTIGVYISLCLALTANEPVFRAGASILEVEGPDHQMLGRGGRGGHRRVVGVVKYYFILSCTGIMFQSGEF